MHFVVLLEDSPSADPGIRKTHMPAHLAYLEANSKNITAAGPLSTSAGEPAGGIWLVEAASESEVEQLVHDDPFWPTGLRKSFTILKWTRVYADGKRLIDP